MTDTKETLCWKCENYFFNWCQNLKPVNGWDAEKTIIHDTGDGDIDSYLVKNCPEFYQTEKATIREILIKIQTVVRKAEIRSTKNVISVLLPSEEYDKLSKIVNITKIENMFGYKIDYAHMADKITTVMED